MDILRLHFRTLRFFGLWYETKSQHWLIKFIWKPFIVIVILFFTLSLLSSLTVYRDNINDFTECLFLSLTYVGLCFKLLNFLSRRQVMNELLDEFRYKICQPTNQREKDVLGIYKRTIAIVYNIHIGLAQFSNIVFAILPLLSLAVGDEDIFLPFKIYEIYDRRNLVYYWVTYSFEIIVDAIGISVNVTLDTMLAGFLLLTCGQIDLCCYRYASSSSNEIKKSTKDCVVHLVLIRRIVKKLESFFMQVVVPLMFLSLITFCTSVYNISQANSSGAESVSFFVYLLCLLCQLGCYCWFGNELKLKSTAICDTIYNSNWTVLIPLDRKNLYFIMLSCQKELSISFHGFCTISLEIFVWVLKTSYTAYNLLKTVETSFVHGGSAI